MDDLTRLAHRAGAGDSMALERLVQTSYEQVWRLCATVVDPQSADDLAQETFARAVRALPRFRGGSAALTWLLAIARYTCLDELRARTRQRRRDAALADDLERHHRAASAAGDTSDAIALADLVEALDLDRRTAFTLTQVLGLSYDEAARVCDCPVGTIRSRVARARADLVEMVNRSGHERRSSRSWPA
jgi:RNA polymerase sigma-70 factor (ECF subfamily)